MSSLHMLRDATSKHMLMLIWAGIDGAADVRSKIPPAGPSACQSCLLLPPDPHPRLLSLPVWTLMEGWHAQLSALMPSNSQAGFRACQALWHGKIRGVPL